MAERDAVRDVARAICEDLAGWPPPVDDARGAFAASLWRALSDSGLTRISVAEAAGGSGGTFADMLAVAEVAAEFAAPVPLTESALLGSWLLASAGHDLPPGPVTAAVAPAPDDVELVRRASSWSLSGILTRVPWARVAERVAILATHDGQRFVVSIDPRRAEIELRANLAGEPRDDLRFTDVVVDGHDVRAAPDDVNAEAIRYRGALSRAALMSGAMTRVQELSVEYAGVREQFGRPINRFQAVQFLLVRLAEEVACSQLATAVAIGCSGETPSTYETAMAKIATSAAARVVCAAAHQVHGAIGMTREYPLHALTRRLWSWRDEFGNEKYWSLVVGKELLAAGVDSLWPRVTAGLAPERAG